MSSRFFENFPVIQYDGRALRNVILKSRVIREVLESVEAMHPFVVRDGERADTVAYDYYGDSELYWLVLMANSIVDPYYGWPMDQGEFRAYVVKKYGSVEAAMQTVVYWTNPDYDYPMSPETRALLAGPDTVGWNTPVYAYDVENEANEAKRSIRLIDVSYVQQVLTEVAKIYG